mgnify:CR=1 FL=1|jgi:Protease II
MSFDLSAATPPVAEKRPKSDTIHGHTRVDDYHWLREKGTEAVTAYLEAENAYTEAVFLKPTEALRQKLYDEILSHIQETDLSVPYPQSGWHYYMRTEEGKQYPIYCRTKEAPSAPSPGFADPLPGEQVTLDLNVLAEGQEFLALGAYSVSDDGRLLAYSTDVTGFREYTLHIKNLETGETLPDRIEKVGAVAWSADGQYLFYTTEDAAKRPYRVYRHRVGEADNANDALVYEEPDGLYRAFLARTRDRQLLFLGSAASTSTEYHYLRSENPLGKPALLRAREAEHEYYVDHRDGLFYIRTNKDATNFRLVVAPVDAPAEWSEIVPHVPDVMLEDHDCFRNHLVLSLRVDGLPVLRIRDLSDNSEHDITFPEPAYTVSGDVNREFDTNVFRFRYASLVTPMSVFDYDMATRERKLLKETPVPGGYDRTQYASERIFATAEDGTRIPVALVYKKGVPRDGSAPCLLYGYGSYGISIPDGFSASRLPLLDRGVVYAIAHIRGGGELGKPWHDAGKMMLKKNTFTDFIACAEHLIAEKYTSSSRLAILGGSAGGLLMGAVSNLRPDLFKAVVSIVPFVDVMNTMRDDTLPLTIGEYLEWGNPNEEPAYRYMLSYSPYDNLEAKAYPTTLVRTSLNDSQVMYWEPAKYVAKLRTLKTDDNPLLLYINMAAGHGGSSGRYDAIRETAIDHAFVLTALGVPT